MRESAPLQPVRDPQVTLPDLLAVLLNKGVYLNLDLIISVAEIPLIGVNLRATLAGMETMLEYGMMQQWDKQTRASVQRSIARQVPLLPEEEVVARMAGGVYAEEVHRSWRPGTVYLTDRRLLVFRRDPAEVLWQTPWESIRAVTLPDERTVGGEHRHRMLVELVDGSSRLLSARDPERLLSLVAARVPGGGLTQTPRAVGSRPGSATLTEALHAELSPDVLRESRAWYQETRSGSALWREGTARLDRRAGLTWRSPSDARAAVNLVPQDIAGVEVRRSSTPSGEADVLAVATGHGVVLLAVEDAARWAELIRRITEESTSHHVREVDSAAHR
ncbi:gas vesicle protein [Micromonospora olivasterospora]|uniref:Gas vesicle protein GvpA/GvpJ/GvpM family n=1 Tax=Micromonospora olivasterospora TaxID=1880 RepID=A0A562IDP0_MICOL|nr:gas vesicle protein [Micromonospora olivasterospora]TWH69080.1 gas vesicle protein GvpA/GvpJ/GvpM family [Micromonospora olivasterospora]